MSWADVDKKASSGAGRFVQFETDKTVTLRLLDEQPFTNRVHKISQVVSKGGKEEEVFRNVPATTNPDDSYILQHNGKRYPETMLYSMRCWVYRAGEDGKITADGDLKILQGGKQIFTQLRNLFNEHGHLNKFDVQITKKGDKRETEYLVSASPFSKTIDTAKLTAEVEAKEEFKWANIFPEVTGAEQAKIIKEAGFDMAYDPAAKLVETMPKEIAHGTQITFGKYKGKTVGELVIIDAPYVSWAAENVHTNDVVAAACRVAVKHMAQVEASQAPKQVAAPAPAPESTGKTGRARGDLVDIANQIIEPLDLEESLALVKRHGGGKTRIKDLTVPQLEALIAEKQNG